MLGAASSREVPRAAPFRLRRQLSSRWSPPGRPVSCWEGGDPDAGPSARKRRRAAPALLSAAFRDCADFEMFRRFRISRNLDQPDPARRNSIFFEMSTKGKSWERPNPGRVSGPRCFGGIVSCLLAGRCPGCPLLLGKRWPGRDAIRAETATRQPSASLRSVSNLRRFRDVSTFPDFAKSRPA